MGSLMLTQRLSENMVGNACMYQEELGRQLPSGNAKAMGLASQAGEAYQRQTQTEMGLGLWRKAITSEAATPSRLDGAGSGYSSKPIHTKRQFDGVILHAAFFCPYLRLRLGLRPWGLWGWGGGMASERARVWGIGSS